MKDGGCWMLRAKRLLYLLSCLLRLLLAVFCYLEIVNKKLHASTGVGAVVGLGGKSQDGANQASAT